MRGSPAEHRDSHSAAKPQPKERGSASRSSVIMKGALGSSRALWAGHVAAGRRPALRRIFAAREDPEGLQSFPADALYATSRLCGESRSDQHLGRDSATLESCLPNLSKESRRLGENLPQNSSPSIRLPPPAHPLATADRQTNQGRRIQNFKSIWLGLHLEFFSLSAPCSSSLRCPPASDLCLPPSALRLPHLRTWA